MCFFFCDFYFVYIYLFFLQSKVMFRISLVIVKFLFLALVFYPASDHKKAN